jgi:hypothetical protein
MDEPVQADPTRPARKTEVSPAKREANQKNGKCGRGPVSEEGRKRSAMNALKLGIYAQSKVLPWESQADFDDNVSRWVAELDAETVSENFFACAAAHAAWRFSRGVQALDAHDELRARRARRRETPDEDQERREAEIIAEGLYREPRHTVVRLRKTAAGCDWLRAQWSALLQRVEDDDCYFHSERIRAVFLLGKQRWEVLDDPTLRRFYRYFLGAFLSLHPELKAMVVQIFREELPTAEHGYIDDREFPKRLNQMVHTELPATCAEAAGLMRAFIGEIMAELEARAARLRQQRAEDAPLETSSSPQDLTGESDRRQRQIMSYYRMARMAEADARRLRNERRRQESKEPDEKAESSGNDSPEKTPKPMPMPEPPCQDAETPPAAAVESGSTRNRADRSGPGAAVLPALVLLLLAPLLAGRGRATAPESPRIRAVALEAAARAVDRTADLAVEAMPHENRHGAPRPDTSGLDAPYLDPEICRNEPKLGASPAASAESNFGIAKAVSHDPRARDSPELRRPPPEQP